MRRPTQAVVLLALGLCASTQALAQTQVSDADTGLGLGVPSGFTVTRGTPRPKQDVVFNVRSANNQPVAKNADGTLCAAAFANAAANAKMTQAEINDWVGKPEWRNLAKATLELVFTVDKTESTEMGGVQGVVFHATPKPDMKDPDVFLQLSVFETPRGRTSLVCVTNRGSVESALPVFQTIRSGLKLPR